MMRRRALLGSLACSVVGAGCLSTRGPSVPAGAAAPAFNLGGEVSLDSLTATGPAVVVFYRGYW
jgi:hypothetical protein